MNRQEYLSKLESGLGSMSYKDVKEILAEISEYFDEGIAAGKTEEELAIKLGSPEYLARAYAEGTALPPALVKKEAPKKAPEKDKTASTMFVIFFNLLVAVPLWILILCALFAGVLIEGGVIAAMIALIPAIGSMGNFILAGLFFDLTLLFAAILIAVLLYFGIKYFIIGTKSYIKWNKKIWNEGF
ncbi:Uncharacterized membrane protein [Ruminococcaceae bacterium KH2T8]|nr:Uncharacterized membrane protein [Ruminococcaceae bacterium KH2T8]